MKKNNKIVQTPITHNLYFFPGNHRKEKDINSKTQTPTRNICWYACECTCRGALASNSALYSTFLGGGLLRF
jgi:hypothetical protein